jgi:CRP-like cAMP-binding protein/serine/threonine protein phosphatase PrpC
MGGGSSKSKKDANGEVKKRRQTKIGAEAAYKVGPLSRTNIVKRLTMSETNETGYGPGFSLIHSAVSQRGYYPEALGKANQDAFLIQPSGMGKMKGKGLFGVFDGHGNAGDACSQFVKERLPQNVQLYCTANPKTEYKKFTNGFSRAFTETNIQMHEANFNDKMSGTTAIVMFVDGCTVYIANIGDSRAIIAYEEGDKLKVAALSIDQTPFRYDERERVKRAGARVMTMDQIEGSEPIHENWGLNLGDEIDSEGNPPRVWSQVGNYPGCAFTRSLGDQVAETLGVFAEPEILKRDITPTDKFIILGSDGVFEFITSQAVAEMAAQHEEPLEACRSIVAEAYRMWMTYEIRTDDITIIMLNIVINPDLFDVADIPPVPQSPGHDLTSLRPVRRGLSKAKRTAIMGRKATAHEDRDTKFVVSEHAVDKTEEERVEIRKAIKVNFLFAHLNAKQTEDIVAVMQPQIATEGETIITQGSRGDFFYIVMHGNFDVYVKKREDSEEDGPGTLVHTYLSSTGVHPAFGELALMYAKPRAASVVCKTDGKLWALNRKAFRHIVMRSSHQELCKTLRGVSVLESLTMNEIQRLADVMTEVSFAKDEVIVQQGDVGDSFFVIKTGHVLCRIQDRDDDDNVQVKDVLTLGADEYFGERSLLHDQPRAASVIATVDDTTVFEISRKAFEEVLGSLDAIINDHRKKREAKGLERAQNYKRTLYNQQTFSNLRLSGIENLLPIGRVADVGDVQMFLCQHRVNNSRMTMKVIGKSQVLKTGTEDNLLREKELLAAVGSTALCIPALVATYHVGGYLYTLLAAPCICTMSALLEESLFSEEKARFFAALLLLALRHLHVGGAEGGADACTMLRGLTPDSTMVDADGYPQITDFRLAKRLTGDEQSYTLCGTPEYIAPEIIAGQGHGLPVDYWTMGCLIFEMLAGHTPFQDTDTSPELHIYARASNHTKGGRHINMPEGASEEVKEVIHNLLDPDVKSRMTFGLDATATAAWFTECDLEKMQKRELPSPHIGVLQKKARALGEQSDDFKVFEDHRAKPANGEDWTVFDDF